MSYFLLGGAVLCLILVVAHAASQQTAQSSPHQEPDRSELPVSISEKQSHGKAVSTTLYRSRSYTSLSVSERESQLYGRLLTMALGDKDKVERLISYESTRSPHASRAELIQDAIDRWVRDIRWS